MIRVVAIVLPLGLDTFAISAALGASGLQRSSRVRVAAVFCACEMLMPLVGVALGAPLGHALGAAADYVAIAVLAGVGISLMLERDDEADRLRGVGGMGTWAVLLLGLSVSLDELAIGFTLGLLRLPIVPVVALIGIQAFALALLGMRLGARLAENVREGAERLAGLALVVLAAVLLTENLAS